MATYPGFVYDGSAWQPIGSQIADLSPYALADGSNMAGYGVWTDYTVTPITATAGTPTSVSAVGKYVKIGKTVHIRVVITVTTKGTAAGSIIGALPISVVERSVGLAADYNAGAPMGFASFTGGSFYLVKYDATTFWADGAKVTLTGTYEVA
jgi:hypothetical protein